MSRQKKAAVINDISGYGRCAITVALPIISKLKVQCCPVPTSIFSNHTGFPTYYFDDYTERMQPFIEQWKKLGLKFDGIQTGFLGSKKQIEIVSGFIRDFRQEETIVVVDPIMGDNGKSYATYTEEMCQEMRRLVTLADIITPNLTEACILTGTGYHEEKWKMKELRKLAMELRRMGPKKVVITGIHLASYGRDSHTSLIDLLRQINAIEGIKRIRLGSLEPTLMQKEFIEELVKLEKICDHFHLSLQSGCNETLQRMNRKYTKEEFEEGIKLIRKNFPHASLTTDIIVGFPGETEEEFQETYQFLKQVNFYKMHIFKYSPRKGTKAATMPNQIEGKIKEQRSKKLIELSKQNQEEQNKAYMGKEVEVLLEEQEGEYIKGHTSNYIMVYVKSSDKALENTIQKVRIAQIKGETLVGKTACPSFEQNRKCTV